MVVGCIGSDSLARRLPSRIGHRILFEASGAEQARVAAFARFPRWIWVIARKRLGIVDPKLQTFADDLRLGPSDQRGMDDQPVAFDSRLGCQVSHGFIGSNVFGPAIGISAVVQCVDTDVDIQRPEDLGPG